MTCNICKKRITRDQCDSEFEGYTIHLECEPLNMCDECGEIVDKLIGCPDGTELCQQCFNTGGYK